ncbi:MAG TPA: hypothetical protein VMJ66_17395 [Geobacteraceae bacterium]|nr:hypothetical protein [Geobacteraceae bacterium]
MIRLLRIKYYQFTEQWQKDGFFPACKYSLYRCEEAVPVEKDLSTLDALKPPPDSDDCSLAELDGQSSCSVPFHYLLRSRKEKTVLNFQKGYCTFVLVKNNQAIADVWCTAGTTKPGGTTHPDLKRFAITLNPGECYLFDMFLSLTDRRKGMATFFVNSVLHALKNKGFKKVYGYFDAKNIPALWVHRLLGYKEMPRYVIKKVLLFETVKAKT